MSPQGNFKGESVVMAILPSSMEASYCTSGFFFFLKLSLPSNFVKRVLPFSRGLKSCTHLGYCVLKYAAMILCADRAEWPHQIWRYNTSIPDLQHGRCPIALTQGLKRDVIPPFKFFGLHTSKCNFLPILWCHVIYHSSNMSIFHLTFPLLPSAHPLTAPVQIQW